MQSKLQAFSVLQNQIHNTSRLWPPVTHSLICLVFLLRRKHMHILDFLTYWETWTDERGELAKIKILTMLKLQERLILRIFFLDRLLSENFLYCSIFFCFPHFWPYLSHSSSYPFKNKKTHRKTQGKMWRKRIKNLEAKYISFIKTNPISVHFLFKARFSLHKKIDSVV